MGAEATGLNGKEALPVVRVRSRVDDATTRSLRTPVSVPFLWEDAPGRPKPRTVPDHDEGPVPLKLPPRLQVPSSTATDNSVSPKTVLQGPYGCSGGSGRRTTALRRTGSVANSFRRTPSAAGGFFSRGKGKSDKKRDGCEHDAAAVPDTSSSSPSPSSASSSSSSYASFFGDDSCGHGARRRPADDSASTTGEDESATANGLVRITRFRRNRSLPRMTTSHLWASICKSVKQIAPWT